MSATRRSIAVPVHRGGPLAFARFRRIPGSAAAVLSNDAGRFHLMPQDDLDRLLAGQLAADSPHAARLADLGFLRRAPKVDVLADRLRERRAYLFQGPSLHIVILTLRCDQICSYCHASRTNVDEAGCDMEEATARRVVDAIFETTSQHVTIEFQGGEPTLNWPVLRFVLEYARERNERARKDLMFSLVTNMGAMTEERADWLIDQGVMICTSLDGPRDVHDANRRIAVHSMPGAMPGATPAATPGAVHGPAQKSAHDEVTRWIARFHEKYAARGLDPDLAYVNALLTVTRATIAHGARGIVDEYVRRGLRAIHLRPLNPFGFAHRTWQRIGYGADDYLAFYRSCVDYIVELNRSGRSSLVEKKTGLHLEKILGDRDPNYMELRSPCGAGVGQLAFNFDGKVYTCDEGRMVARMGDPLFQIGDVNDPRSRPGDWLAHPSVRAMQAASCLDSVPGCSDCAYNPYCGVCPVYHYVEQGDLFAKAPGSDWCRIATGVCDYLFDRLGREGDAFRAVIAKWAEVKDRAAAYRARPGPSRAG